MIGILRQKLERLRIQNRVAEAVGLVEAHAEMERKTIVEPTRWVDVVPVAPAPIGGTPGWGKEG